MATKETLSGNQRMFCHEYVLDHSGKRAYLAAFPNSSPKSAEANASRLLAKDKIQRYIASLESKKIKKLDIGLDAVLAELASIGFSDCTDYAQIQDGNVLINDTNKLTSAQKKAISQIKSGRYGVEIKLHDKTKALTELLRHFELAAGVGDEEMDNSFVEALERKAEEIDWET